MYGLRIIFISIFTVFLISFKSHALDIEVILPKNTKTISVEMQKMFDHIKSVVPNQVSELLNNKLILDFSKKKVDFKIQCPKNLIKNSQSFLENPEEVENNYANVVSFDDIVVPAENLTKQYVSVPSLNRNWNNITEYPLNVMLVNKGFLSKEVSTFPTCYIPANYFSKIDYLEGQILRNIGKIWNRKAKLQSSFLKSKERVRQFSDSSLFSHLDNWGSYTDVNNNKNIWKGDKLKLVAPAVRISPLQNFSLEDSFSIYFEKFLNDKDFACKKPATHMYFKKIMNFSPFGINECKNLNTKIYGGFLNKNTFNLDPSRIKEIHILLAGPGKAMMSRWGHTMFRLVVCEKGESGSDCVSNNLDDIVLGFRAYVGDMQINPIKGVFGKYPSLIFPAKMSDMKNEYNRTGLRDLTSIPVNFTKEERKLFLYKTLQDFWSYRGKYYFLTNNCATESNDFLMGSFLSSPKKSYLLHKLLGRTLTPTGSISDIKKAKNNAEYKDIKNTFDLTKLNKKNKVANRDYVSASYRPTLQKLVSLVKPSLTIKQSKTLYWNNGDDELLNDIIKKEKLDAKSFIKPEIQDNRVEMFASLPIKERVRLYKKLLKNNPKYAISLTLLETYIKKGLEKSIKSNAVSLAINVKNPSPAAKKVLEAFKKVTKSHIQAHSFYSYGVPSRAEVKSFLKKLSKEYKLKKSDITLGDDESILEGHVWDWEDELIERSENLAKIIFPEWSKELKEIENLLKSLREYPKTKTLSF
ncbi:MAG: DUF4105 domain-containing protein [Bdellovibrionales bacterium]|nr:DUF4105 domain-containing protein [Bdellovibrionales bacterium]